MGGAPRAAKWRVARALLACAAMRHCMHANGGECTACLRTWLAAGDTALLLHVVVPPLLVEHPLADLTESQGAHALARKHSDTKVACFFGVRCASDGHRRHGAAAAYHSIRLSHAGARARPEWRGRVCVCSGSRSGETCGALTYHFRSPTALRAEAALLRSLAEAPLAAADAARVR